MEGLKVNIEEKEDCLRLFDIEVPAEEVEKEKEKVLSEIAKEATIPGFRRGRAPRKLIDKRFAKEAKEEAVNRTVAASVQEAIKSNDLEPVLEPEVSDIEHEDGSPLTFKVALEVRPIVEVGEYKGLKLEKPVRRVTEEDIDKTVQEVLRANVAYVPRNDGGAEEGDEVILSFEATIDGEPFKGSEAENVPVYIGRGYFFEEVESALVGASAGDEKEVEATFPDDYRQKEIAGKTALFKIKVNEIKRPEVPEMDDELAQQLGAESAEDYRNKLRERIESSAVDNAESALRAGAMDQVIEASKFEVPGSFVRAHTQEVFDEELRRLLRAGVPREEIVKEQEQLLRACQERAVHQLKTFCALEEIARKENVEITDEMMSEEKTKLSEQPGVTPEQVEKYFSSGDAESAYKARWRRGEAMKAIIDSATITEVEVKEQ